MSEYFNVIKEIEELKERFEKIESLMDAKKMQDIILDGAQLYATILKLEARMKQLEQHTSMLELTLKAEKFGQEMKEGSRFMECLAGLENKIMERIDNIEEQIGNIELNHENKQFFKCPICNGSGLNKPELKKGGWEREPRKPSMFVRIIQAIKRIKR